MDVYDCGELSNVVLTFDSFQGDMNITIDGLANYIFVGRDQHPVSFLCSGELTLPDTFGDIHVVISAITMGGGGGLTEDSLMGLAGIVCAFFLSYVFVKYAV